MLHLSHNASKRRQVASKDAEAIHKSQFMGQSPRLTENFHEHMPVARIAPEPRINERCCPPHGGKVAALRAFSSGFCCKRRTLSNIAPGLAKNILMARLSSWPRFGIAR